MGARFLVLLILQSLFFVLDLLLLILTFNF